VRDQEPASENTRFGNYLRQVREDRKLSLDAVEEMTVGYPGRVTKSHLSRIENGQAVPTFPRMFALSQIYGVPITSLAERFEMDLRRAMLATDIEDKSYDELRDESEKLRSQGRYFEVLAIYDAILDQAAPDFDRDTMTQVKLARINSLIHLARFVSAKDECEDLLSHPWLSAEQRVVALQCFAMCCYRLSKFTFALMALDTIADELDKMEHPDRHRAYMATLKGNLFSVTDRPEEAAEAYAEAIKKFEELSNPFEACRSRINLAFALIELGRRSGARRHLQRALRDAEAQGYDRQMSHALSNLGLLAYKEGDEASAEAYCLRSNSIARPREYVSVVFRNCYYLWRIARSRGDQAGIKANERSLRAYLGRVEDFLPEAHAYRAHLAGGDE